VALQVDRHGGRHEGLAPGIDRRHLLRLRRGEVPVDRELDLHGLDRRGAAAALRRELGLARDRGERCVLVIHGRGARSEGAAVLKEALPGWLGEPPLDALVMAFATARPAEGGEGATYVLLRRSRREAGGPG